MRTRSILFSARLLFVIGLSLFFGVTAAFATAISGFEELTDFRGFDPVDGGLNKYSWSSETFSFDNNVYIGTLNLNFDYHALPEYLFQISQAPQPVLAGIDAFRRIWSGSPITPSTGGEIWRYDGTSFNQVYKADAQHVGFREMTEYIHLNGSNAGTPYIYAGTANGPDGPNPGDPEYKVLPQLPTPASDNTVDYTNSGTALIRSKDGLSWETVSGGPSENKYNSSNRTMATINSKLMVGTENVITGPELWSYDGDMWNLEAQLPLSDGFAIGEIAEFGGVTYLGTWGSDSGISFKLLKYLGGGGTVDVTPSFSDPNIIFGNQGVMQLFEYKGMFYLGTINYLEGFTLMRTSDPMNTDSWEVITTDGFKSQFPEGTSDNAYAWSTQIINGKLYLGTFNTGITGGVLDELLGIEIPLDGRAQIWCTDDGLNWHIVEDNGFDSKFTYGARTMTEWNDRLVVGTASNLLLPDFFSDPYGDEKFDELIAFLIDHDMIEIADSIKNFMENYDGQLPYIGTQVYASNPVPEPATMLLLSTGLVGLVGIGRKKFLKK